MSINDNIKQIKEIFPQFNDEEKIKAFAEMSQIRDAEGASAIMDLLRQYANTGALPENIIWSLYTFREYANIYFPELLNYAPIPKFGHRIYALCFLYIDCKWLPPDQLESHFAGMMSHYHTIKAQWDQSDSYYDNYNQIYHLLEIFGYFPKPDVEAELYTALDLYAEAGLKYQAVSSLWRLGKPVDDKYIVELIADDYMRWSMFWRLQERGELDLFPDHYRTAEAFARASIVSMHENMYATPLDTLEFTEVVPILSSHADNSGDYYIYRVFTDFGQGDDKYWVTGWAGPVPSDFNYVNITQPLTLILFNCTGLSPDQWGSIPPKELVMQHLERFHKGKSG